MTTTIEQETLVIADEVAMPPGDLELPFEDGTFVKNFQEHPQSVLLTSSIKPLLDQRHPDGDYCIGQDTGIYWRTAQPPYKGAEAPDWFYVPDVLPTFDGKLRRSYVLWEALLAPMIVIEFVSGDGREERDRTPVTGKFWVYERGIQVPFYAIYEAEKAHVEVYHLVDMRYQPVAPNERGHYLIHTLGVELGLQQGVYLGADLPWLRWWDAQGKLLLTGEERAEAESLRAEAESLRAEEEQRVRIAAQSDAAQQRTRAERLAAQLRALGVDPDA